MNDDHDTEKVPEDDAALLAELGALLKRVDEPTAAAGELARAALGWRTLDAELAELVADSALQEGELAGVRGVSGPRLVSFQAGELDVELEVQTGERGGAQLVGQLLPPARADVTIEHGHGGTRAHADELGRFRAEGLPDGPVRLRILRPGRPAVVTEWLRL